MVAAGFSLRLSIFLKRARAKARDYLFINKCKEVKSIVTSKA